MPWKPRSRACRSCRATFTATTPNDWWCPMHRAAAANNPERPYHHGERREHEALIQAWVVSNGWWCPGDPESQHGPHPVPEGDLTVHHVVDVAEGAPRVGGQKAILCRAHNSRLGATVRRP